jgi:hypothetical protein
VSFVEQPQCKFVVLCNLRAVPLLSESRWAPAFAGATVNGICVRRDRGNFLSRKGSPPLMPFAVPAVFAVFKTFR